MNLVEELREYDKARHALSTPTDTTALQSLIAEAGEVMRERCAELHEGCDMSILREVTIDDLKGGAT